MDMKTGNQGQVSMVFAFERINETKVHFICFMEFNFNFLHFLILQTDMPLNEVQETRSGKVTCGKFNYQYKMAFLTKQIMIFPADMPTFMLNADRIVGGEAAPSPIPWQVAVLSGSFQFCGATILDEST